MSYFTFRETNYTSRRTLYRMNGKPTHGISGSTEGVVEYEFGGTRDPVREFVEERIREKEPGTIDGDREGSNGRGSRSQDGI